jgi:hypothetical protein
MLSVKLHPQDIGDVRKAARTLQGLVDRGVLAADWAPEIHRLENLASALHLHYTDQHVEEVRQNGGCQGCGKPKEVPSAISHTL